VKKLSLDTLENMTFAQPEMYDKLVMLRRKMRHTYVSGTKTSHGLHQVPFSEPMREAAAEMEEQHTEQGAEDDDQTGEEEDEEVDDMIRPSFNNPEQEEDQADQHEIEPENKRVTRFRGKKHVPVYSIKLKDDKHLDEMINRSKPIINYRNYIKSNNFDTALFRGEGKSSFFARKRALIAHKLVCFEPYCEICNISEKIKTFVYTPSNLSRYNKTIECTQKTNLSNKKVRFVKGDNYKIFGKRTKINLNLINVFRACEQNISFEELSLLKIS
jgi:hypothetical protein